MDYFCSDGPKERNNNVSFFR
ncbi:mscS Mechanosensitive ion channel domain protein, partial [Vibrio harveyi]